ncbi:Diacetyl reductase [(S)-acetoin forming]-like protein [Drosera capensis]
MQVVSHQASDGLTLIHNLTLSFPIHQRAYELSSQQRRRSRCRDQTTTAPPTTPPPSSTYRFHCRHAAAAKSEGRMRSVASSSSNSQKGTAAIVGVGPKLGLSIARKFAREGYTVAILSSDLGRLSRFAEEIAREEKAQVFAIRIDCSDPRSIREAFEGVLSLGFVEVLVYNAYHSSSTQPTSFTQIPIHSFQRSIAVSSIGPFYCAQQVLPSMVERGRGTILFTGCSVSINEMAGFSELCNYCCCILIFIDHVSVQDTHLCVITKGCGKFALRGLSQSLAREFQPQGIHVAHVIIDGIVGQPRGQGRSGVGFEQQRRAGEEGMDPDVLAQTYWQLHIQDRTAWTQEIDLRPT